ncbi:hypothetical protein ACF064_07220 [Streptomyces sp. NPDC015492]|uniref:hypothetical protein n=1 Tax=Streptomyces sp. NPDC015492 TaxID=3364958 RepID=UPI0036F4DF5D
MTTSETRARLGALEQRLEAPTPEPLDGQIDIALDWVCPDYDQETLWPTRPAPLEAAGGVAEEGPSDADTAGPE